jgi:transcription elongation factor GreA
LHSGLAESQFFTRASLEKWRIELNEMKTNGRKKISAAIAEAREKGDLKENAEYDAAKHAQGLLEAEISKLETIIANAKIIDESQLDTSKALILSTVTLRNTKTGVELRYKLVSPKEADMRGGRISVESPVGKGLLGKSVGDISEVVVPAGKIEFEILEITYE